MIGFGVWGAGAPALAAAAGDGRSGAHSAALGWERAQLNYDLDAVRRGEAAAPAVFATALPGDIGSIRDVRQKKRTFIRLVLPLVLESNNRIMAKRRHLENIAESGWISADDRAWLRELAYDYDVDPDAANLIERLLHRVDIIPPSLAIAQSITESGWGTSRFARKGRALYGQRTWSKGAGIVPKARRSGQTFEVKAFRSLLESVTNYMRNLNTHPAYRDLRNRRAKMRAANQTIDGYQLASGLRLYAETGTRYVKEIRTLIRVNRLKDFDNAEIHGAGERITGI